MVALFIIHVPWEEALLGLLVPHITWNAAFLTTLVAIFGTTISPYLFFWQASQEAEDERVDSAAAPNIDHSLAWAMAGTVRTSPHVHQHQTLMTAGLAIDDRTPPALNPSVGTAICGQTWWPSSEALLPRDGAVLRQCRPRRPDKGLPGGGEAGSHDR